MKKEFKKGDLLGWQLDANVRKMIGDLNLEEIVKTDHKTFRDFKVLRQQATKSFTIEITIND